MNSNFFNEIEDKDSTTNVFGIKKSVEPSEDQQNAYRGPTQTGGSVSDSDN